MTPQSDTIAFLDKYEFDFNNVFRNGVSYGQLSRKDELLRKATALVTKQPIDPNEPCSMLSRRSQDLLLEIHKQVAMFLEGTTVQKSSQLTMGEMRVFGENQREVFELNIDSFKVR